MKSFASCIISMLVSSVMFSASAAIGWSCFANGNKVYKCQEGGNAQVVYSGGGDHARWSADGTIIFFSIGNEVWAVNNDGTDPRKIGSHTTGRGSCIAAYRPEPKSVLIVDGDKLSKIDAVTKTKQLVCEFSNASKFYGEIAISNDGKRVVARLGGSLYQATISNKSGTWQKYAGYCSAGISPDGTWLTENQDGHKALKLHGWSSGTKKMNISLSKTWDNQSFAVNSNDWISVLFDTGTNKGDAVGVHRVSTDKTTFVGKVPGGTTQYPDFWVGSLPTPDGGSVTYYDLAVSTTGTGAGSVDLNPAGGTYAEGTSVELTANSSNGSRFVQWSGDVSGTTESVSISMNGNKNVSAEFKILPSYTITASAGIGGNISPSGNVSVTQGNNKSFTISASSGYRISDVMVDNSSQGAISSYRFSNVTSNHTISASFESIPEYTLTTSTTGEGTIDPSDGTYLEGTDVQVTATPTTGWGFVQWQGDLSGTSSSKTITMNGNKSVTAVFEETTVPQVTLTVNVTGSGTIEPAGGTYDEGTVVGLKATPATGWQFSSWGGAASESNDSVTITMDANKTVSATFTETSTTDNTAPSVPTNLSATNIASSGFYLTWDASTDTESGVKEYKIFLNGSLSVTVPVTSAPVTGLTASTQYSVTVVAIDNAGNESPASEVLSVTTLDEVSTEGNLFLKASEGTLSNQMQAVAAPGALAGEAISGTIGNASAPNSTDSKAEYTVTLDSEGTWYAWGRFNFYAGGYNSFWIQVDDNLPLRFGNTRVFDTWLWDGTSKGEGIDLGNLSAGTHTITIYAREAHEQCLMDIICLTQNASYVPTDSDVPAPDKPTAVFQRAPREPIPLTSSAVRLGSKRSGSLEIDLRFTGSYQLEMFSQSGRLVAHRSGSAPITTSLHPSRTTSAVYIVRVRNQDKMIVKTVPIRR